MSALRLSCCLALTLISAVSNGEASAQSVPDPLLQKLVQTAQYQANVARLFATLPADVFRRCPALVSKGSSVTVIHSPSFAPDGYPISGTWKQSFPVGGCGNDTTINFFFTAQPDEKIVSLIAAPGETHADEALQRDALGYAIIAVRAKTTGCSDLNLQSTRFDGHPKADVSGGSTKDRGHPDAWSETWTVAACGRVFTVPLTFIPDSTGTQIAASPATEMKQQ